ncbi:hypothetical protein BATDEDRAFT_87325 [Batrachochytrium dendrobatidis JAM81]|uniref:Uncharacterized protein n=2 Tax=Batrachochytrium dendrobatidis TaxID=109871 RepID=F4NY96_BATDJ|nr:uncharacterized protein BATDEDRAFT_87325 [Batrachochytrium dendrobatidis JAM81]EGF81979.1 hypothetical protein BATDEDRAFT_87325 [Batrachochytrium dendrobatidis JAM81]OAJ40762.1 hypothetical protein BDEG_24462 [Batrachochytrium dendrobatidis JEL423]|eukprot:XP_006677592.1 hypothetical protein BATDEDRAFT_87325 [Batrachochytrium dendrobatidis JAM81]
MKLSIAVLSSILAICSVTIANPVDPSSTMSAAASTPTASSSGASADGSDSPESLSLYKFKKYCGQLDATEVSLIEKIAKARLKSTKVFRLLESQYFGAAIQEGLFVREKEKLNSMSQVPSRKLSSAKAKHVESRQTCDRASCNAYDYASKLLHKKKKIKKLTKKLTSHSSFGIRPSDDYTPPKSLYGYQDCFKYFYDRLSQ